MTGLFERVLHHLEGNETESQKWQTADGIKTVEFHSFGPDRWIESVHERGRMTGIECLAMILFEVDVSLHNPEPARRIVEAWAVELRKAVSTGEIQARDPVTLLALETPLNGWEWLLSMADADKFIAARGMDWRFADVALHLFTECEQNIQNRRFPPWMQTAPVTDTTPPAPAERVRAINRATQEKWVGIKNDLKERHDQNTVSLLDEWQERLDPAPPQRVEPLTAPAQTAAPVAASTSVFVQKQRAQEIRILQLLTAQGYDPLKLAQRAPGKPGPKAEIRTLALNENKLFSKSSFDKAWERLRNDGAVAGAE